VVHESGAVALEVPGLSVSGETVYTVFATGLVGGEPALQAVPSVDAAPFELPATGGLSESWLYALATLGLGSALVGGGLWVRRKAVEA
jgi:hypothetical protein